MIIFPIIAAFIIALNVAVVHPVTVTSAAVGVMLPFNCIGEVKVNVMTLFIVITHPFLLAVIPVPVSVILEPDRIFVLPSVAVTLTFIVELVLTGRFEAVFSPV